MWSSTGGEGAGSFRMTGTNAGARRRVARGGAYSTPPQSIRHAKRDKYKSDEAYDHIGFRVIRTGD